MPEWLSMPGMGFLRVPSQPLTPARPPCPHAACRGRIPERRRRSEHLRMAAIRLEVIILNWDHGNQGKSCCLMSSLPVSGGIYLVWLRKAVGHSPGPDEPVRTIRGAAISHFGEALTLGTCV